MTLHTVLEAQLRLISERLHPEAAEILRESADVIERQDALLARYRRAAQAAIPLLESLDDTIRKMPP